VTLHSALSNTTHTKCCYFNVLLYLTSPLLTECDSKTGTDNRRNMYSNSFYCRLILHLGPMSLMFISFTLLLPISGPTDKTDCVFLFLFACL